MRKNLLEVAKGKEWADIYGVDGGAREATDHVPGNEAAAVGDRLSIEDFCKYKYVIYTEASLPAPPLEQ